MAKINKSFHPTDRYVGSRLRMRRMMLSMSQERLGDALGLTFQQVQKYERGANRVSASRLQQLSRILEVPITFFFEGAPNPPGSSSASGKAPSPEYVTNFLATHDGLNLTKAFTRIKNAKVRRAVVDLVELIADEYGD